MFASTQFVSLSRRFVAFSVVAASSVFAGAQTSALNLNVPATSGFSSSADTNADVAAPAKDMSLAEEANAVSPFHFADAYQYGGGRRGGRPRYRGGNQNADGSSKWTFEAGVGFTSPVQDTRTYLADSYAFGAGFGRRFSQKFATLLQFDWDNFGFQNSTLQSQTNLYNGIINYCSQNPSCSQGQTLTALNQLGGTSHVWSFTLDPEITLIGGHDGLGLYAIGGFGFYHKTANFTTPQSGYCYDPYYGYYYQCTANSTIDKYTSNAVGVNGGAGVTYKFSRFSGEKLFAEIRYVYVANQNKPGLTAATLTSSNYLSTANDYPANSHQTYYFPIKVGIRF